MPCLRDDAKSAVTRAQHGVEEVAVLVGGGGSDEGTIV